MFSPVLLFLLFTQIRAYSVNDYFECFEYEHIYVDKNFFRPYNIGELSELFFFVRGHNEVLITVEDSDYNPILELSIGLNIKLRQHGSHESNFESEYNMTIVPYEWIPFFFLWHDGTFIIGNGEEVNEDNFIFKTPMEGFPETFVVYSEKEKGGHFIIRHTCTNTGEDVFNWRILYHQSNGVFESQHDRSKLGSHPLSSVYRDIENMDQYRDSNGKFTFSLVWTDPSTYNQIWSQQSDPTKQGPVTGYEDIDVPYKGCGWSGLKFSIQHADMHGGYDNFAVGSYDLPILGPCTYNQQFITDEVFLFVRLPPNYCEISCEKGFWADTSSECKDGLYPCRECSSCISGISYLTQPCLKTQDTKCEYCTLCSFNYYLAKECTEYVNSYCRPCYECTENTFEIQSCNLGSYHPRICKNCSTAESCPVGTREVSPCSKNSDHVCGKCSKCTDWQYLSASCYGSRDSVCTNCTVCSGATPYVLTPCNETEDTKCSAYKHDSTTKTVSVPSNAADPETDWTKIGLFTGTGILVLLFIVAIFLVHKRWRRKKSIKNKIDGVRLTRVSNEASVRATTGSSNDSYMCEGHYDILKSDRSIYSEARPYSNDYSTIHDSYYNENLEYADIVVGGERSIVKVNGDIDRVDYCSVNQINKLAK